MDQANRAGHGLRPLLLLIVVAAAILYGSLYPFIFHISGDGHAAIAHLLSTWRDPPQSRGDLVSNILLYIPLGFVASMVGPPRALGLWGLLLALLTGTALSFSVESVQFYDAGRVSCMSDFYLNVFGSFCGWLLSRAKLVKFNDGLWSPETPAPFARMLLAAWIGWRLFPYVPVIDLHKYWRSVKPLVLTPSLDPYEIFRFSVLWLATAFLLWFGIRPKRFSLSVLVGLLGVLAAKIFIEGQVITAPEVLGAVIAGCAAPVMFRYPRAAGRLLALSFLIVVIANRILPWTFSDVSRPFQWLPFYGFLHGSVEVDVVSFAEKWFLYGTLFLLLIQAGFNELIAAAFEVILLLTTSVVETHLSSRSGEITDAFMVIILLAVYFILKRGPWKTVKEIP